MTAEVATVAPVTETVRIPKVCKLLKREGDSKVLVLTLKGTEEWFPLTEDGKKNLVRLRDGQNVKLGFEGVNGVYHLKMLLPADENGQYDKEGWVKSSGGGKGFGGGGYQKSDPTLELIRNLSILNESVLDKSLDLVKFAKGQNMSDKQIEDMWALIIKLAKAGTNELYQEIQKTHRYQGGA